MKELCAKLLHYSCFVLKEVSLVYLYGQYAYQEVTQLTTAPLHRFMVWLRLCGLLFLSSYGKGNKID